MLCCFLKGYSQNSESAFSKNYYSVQELENIFANVNFNNHKQWLTDNGYKFILDDTGQRCLFYEKNENVKLLVFYAGIWITQVYFQSTDGAFAHVLKTIEGNKSYKKIKEETETDNKGVKTKDYKWTKGAYVYMGNEYSGTLGMLKDYSEENSKLNDLSTVTPITSNADFTSAGEFADEMNKNFRFGRINFGGPSYKFNSLGKLNFHDRSILFTTQGDRLYIKMNIPLEGDCDYGLKEIKAIRTGQTGTSTKTFYIAFKYTYQCGVNSYQTLYLFFDTLSDSFREKAIRYVTAYCRE